MNIKTVIIGNWRQPFVTNILTQTSAEGILDATGYEMIKDEMPSQVIRINGKKQILKLVKARQWVEYFKLFWNRSRISKEIKGNHLLADIGVKVPAILEAGFGFLPCRHYRFLGYYIMQDLDAIDFTCAKIAYSNNLLKAQSRADFFNNITQDVIKMRNHRMVFNDFKLGNIFCSQIGEAIWIDTGITKYPFYQTKTFKRKHNFSMDRFLLRHEKVLTTGEKQAIVALKFPSGSSV